MKQIKLSSRQFDKLEEMIKYYFPRFDEIIFERTSEIFIELEEGTLHCPYKTAPFVIWLIDNKRDVFDIFPWFEFCFRYLVPKILFSEHRQWKMKEWIFDKNSKHLVSYLYKEYKLNKR